MNYPLTSTDKLTLLIQDRGIRTWKELVVFVKNLPYGRNANRHDFTLVLRENKGSCSSKHAFLKKVADLNNIPNIKLYLGIYKMSASNTPKIGDVLSENAIDFIPEAHCYLQINASKYDYTSPLSDFSKIQNDILTEIEIKPEQVAEFKVEFHKNFIKNWLTETNSNFDFNQLWSIRETCIKNLSQI